MADQSALFQTTVKSLRKRQRVAGASRNLDKHDILPHSRHKSEFDTKAKDMVGTISQLRDFLLEHRKDYINAGSSIKKSVMTDAERDQIDSDAQKIIKACQEMIISFQQDAITPSLHIQVKDHREAVFDLIGAYLKVVCKLYSEQRAVRVKRIVDRKRLSRLEPEPKIAKFDSLASTQNGFLPLRQSGNLDTQASDSDAVKSPQTEVKPTSQNVMSSSQTPAVLPDDSDVEDQITSEEAQMFEQENQSLYNEMNSMMNEVRQIEGRVVEISRLQEIFADKVLEQTTDIDRIGDTVVSSTENVKDANEEIRQAMKNNAGLRVWIIFILAMCSFSLLFLDWYND